VRNGVDTTNLFATLDAIEAQAEIARSEFRADNRDGVGRLPDGGHAGAGRMLDGT
jgi:hypothetical protein